MMLQLLHKIQPKKSDCRTIKKTHEAASIEHTTTTTTNRIAVRRVGRLRSIAAAAAAAAVESTIHLVTRNSAPTAHRARARKTFLLVAVRARAKLHA